MSGEITKPKEKDWEAGVKDKDKSKTGDDVSVKLSHRERERVPEKQKRVNSSKRTFFKFPLF